MSSQYNSFLCNKGLSYRSDFPKDRAKLTLGTCVQRTTFLDT